MLSELQIFIGGVGTGLMCVAASALLFQFRKDRVITRNLAAQTRKPTLREILDTDMFVFNIDMSTRKLKSRGVFHDAPWEQQTRADIIIVHHHGKRGFKIIKDRTGLAQNNVYPTLSDAVDDIETKLMPSKDVHNGGF